MSNFLTIIFAYRNRDLKRIRCGMESLAMQKNMEFEVIFVDYGSEEKNSSSLDQLLKKYSFARYYYVANPELLWNKSKALNYAIRKTTTPYIFIGDVDLIFPEDSISAMAALAEPESFSLFKLGYLSEEETKRIQNESSISNPNRIERFGTVNGAILAPTKALKKVHGLDEFFHFYGAEDVDLFNRLENSGLKRRFQDKTSFYHLWHKSYIRSKTDELSIQPRLTNIMRLNERHYFINKKKKLIVPENQDNWGIIKTREDAAILEKPDCTLTFQNKLANVEHFLNEELKYAKKGVLKAEFTEDKYYDSIKHRLKKIFKKETQIYCSLKEINDMILKKILFEYRHYNYSYKVTDNLDKIIFTIQIN